MDNEKPNDESTRGSTQQTNSASRGFGDRRKRAKSTDQRVREAVKAIRYLSSLMPVKHGYDFDTIIRLIALAVAARVSPFRLEELIERERIATVGASRSL